jgi:acyl carrier protein
MSTGSSNAQLKHDLKCLIVQQCQKDIDPSQISDDEPLLGEVATLHLDSLDVLQINVALAKKYHVRVQDVKHALRVMQSINTLADFVQPAG